MLIVAWCIVLQAMIAARKAAVEHTAPVLVEFMTYREGKHRIVIIITSVVAQQPHCDIVSLTPCTL